MLTSFITGTAYGSIWPSPFQKIILKYSPKLFFNYIFIFLIFISDTLHFKKNTAILFFNNIVKKAIQPNFVFSTGSKGLGGWLSFVVKEMN